MTDTPETTTATQSTVLPPETVFERMDKMAKMFADAAAEMQAAVTRAQAMVPQPQISAPPPAPAPAPALPPPTPMPTVDAAPIPAPAPAASQTHGLIPSAIAFVTAVLAAKGGLIAPPVGDGSTVGSLATALIPLVTGLLSAFGQLAPLLQPFYASIASLLQPKK